MGEDALAETRVAIGSQRRELERTADQLRASLDLRQQFRRNPVPFIAAGAGIAFLVAGGPGRVAGLVRRQLFPSNAEKAYDALPKPMQSWVDHMAGAVGPRADEAREALAEELARWRADPRRHGKVNKKLARQIAEGPPGPGRTAWTAAEAAASIIVVALARKAVERLLSGEPEPERAADMAEATAQARRAEPVTEDRRTPAYSQMSDRARS